MHIDKQKLKQYVYKIKDFEKLGEVELLLYLGYYIQTEKNQSYFRHNHINEYLSYVPLHPLKNIDQLICKLQEDDRLIPYQKDFSQLPLREIKRIESELHSINNRIENIYDIDEIYNFNKDVRSIFLNAETKIFLIDPYADEDIIHSYVDKIPNQIEIIILTTKKYTDKFLNQAKKFKRKSNNFKVKINNNIHDRLFFVDKRCFVMGQSFGNPALTYPTYLVEIENAGSFRAVFQKLYDEGDNLNLDNI